MLGCYVTARILDPELGASHHGTGKIRGCQYDSCDCYNKALKIAEKKNRHPPGHDMEILTVEDNERARKDHGPNKQEGSMCNMISIKEITR